MARLLYVEASPRKDRSASIEVSRAFLEAYRLANPDDEVETLDIWAAHLPTFNGEALAAKYAGINGVPLSAGQQAVWDDIRSLAAPFLAADKLLLAVPLWNFGIPYRLKQLIDLISQKDILFSFDGTAFRYHSREDPLWSGGRYRKSNEGEADRDGPRWTILSAAGQR